MMKPIVLIAALCALGLAGCSNNKNLILYEGQAFRAKVGKVDKQRDVFVVTVKDAGKSIDGARAAAHQRGTEYCVENFGTSQIIWNVDPLDPQTQITLTDNTLTFQGQCPQAQRF